MSFSLSVVLAIVLFFDIIQSYRVGKYLRENNHLKEEIERLKHDLLQSQIVNLQQENETLKRQNNFSTDMVE